MVEILAHFNDTDDWGRALEKVIPRRKEFTVKSASEEEDDDEVDEDEDKDGDASDNEDGTKNMEEIKVVPADNAPEGEPTKTA